MKRFEDSPESRPHVCLLCGQTFHSWMVFSVAFSMHVSQCVNDAFGSVANSYQGYETNDDVFKFLEGMTTNG